MMWGRAANTYSYPLYQDLLERSQPFSGLICQSHKTLNLSQEGVPERVEVDLVSGNFFDVLAVPPALGRTLSPEDERQAQSRPVAVLSYGYWKRRFGGDPGVVGKTLLLEREPIAVVGVASEKFHSIELGQSPDLYLPITMGNRYFSQHVLSARRYIWLQIVGRLRSGVTLKEAQAALSPTFRQILETDMEKSPGVPDYAKQRYLQQSLDLQPGAQGIDNLQRMAQRPIGILWLVVMAVLLIACANVAGLQIAQAVRRRKEVALRLGLGASRWRLIRLLLIESIILAIMGGVSGLIIGWWALGGLQQLVRTMMTLDEFSGLNPRVLGLTAFVTLGSALIFGLAPALRAIRIDLLPALKNDGQAVSIKSHELGRQVLAISQIALSVLLLAIAGLFLRTLLNLYRIEPGFAHEKLLDVRFDPQPDQYSPSQAEALAQALVEHVRTLRGVKGVFLANDSIFSDGHSFTEVRTEGHNDPGRENLTVCEKSVAPGYFSGLGIPLLAGRDFSRFDSKTAPMVAIANESFAKYFFNGRNPVGEHFKRGNSESVRGIEIVGMVKDTAFGGGLNKKQRLYFLCLNQTGFYSGALHVRIDGDPEQLTQAVRRQMALLDPGLPLWEIHTAEEKLADETSGERVMALMTGIFAGAATFLAAVGIFGLLSFFVAQRSREIGIRIALGAERSGAIWLVMKQTLVLSGIGLAIGLVLTIAVSRYLKSMLYEVQPVDPITLILTATLIGAVALIASMIPAHHAASVDPIAALRSE
jgi:predicted permease